MTFAPPWRRCLSRVIDLASLALLLGGGFFALQKFSAQQFQFFDALVFVVVIGYEVGIPFVTLGSSMGRFVMRIRLRNELGEVPPSLVQCFARAGTRVAMFALVVVFVAYEVELPAVLLVVAVEAVSYFLTANRQTLGDLVARTVVVVREAQ
jgi:uncharacterized RDD family membrane protein YckC